jgi:hypothetical protein
MVVGRTRCAYRVFKKYLHRMSVHSGPRVNGSLELKLVLGNYCVDHLCVSGVV